MTTLVSFPRCTNSWYQQLYLNQNSLFHSSLIVNIKFYNLQLLNFTDYAVLNNNNYWFMVSFSQLSYGCMKEVAKHKGSVRFVWGDCHRWWEPVIWGFKNVLVMIESMAWHHEAMGSNTVQVLNFSGFSMQ